MTVITDREPPIVQDWWGPLAPCPDRVARPDPMDASDRRHRAAMADRQWAMGVALSDLALAYGRVGDLPRRARAMDESAVCLQAWLEMTSDP